MGEKRSTTVREKNMAELFKYLSDVNNEWPTRQEYSALVFGYKCDNQIYKTLSPDDITKVENDALEAIKKKSAGQRRDIYKALYDKAKDGSVAAAKEFLDRTEGPVTQKRDIISSDGSMSPRNFNDFYSDDTEE